MHVDEMLGILGTEMIEILNVVFKIDIQKQVTDHHETIMQIIE